MSEHIIEAVVLDEVCQITLTELGTASGFSLTQIQELVELGVISPRAQGEDHLFASRCIDVLRTARRLQADFELGLPELALVMTYIDRIRILEERLRELEGQLPPSRRG